MTLNGLDISAKQSHSKLMEILNAELYVLLEIVIYMPRKKTQNPVILVTLKIRKLTTSQDKMDFNPFTLVQVCNYFNQLARQ